jgi:hypothetical protein
MSLEAIAALLGHRSLDMTLRYTKIASRTVADEYFAVTEKVEAIYGQPAQLPADAAGPKMTRPRREHHRLLAWRLAGKHCSQPDALAPGWCGNQPWPGGSSPRRGTAGSPTGFSVAGRTMQAQVSGVFVARPGAASAVFRGLTSGDFCPCPAPAPHPDADDVSCEMDTGAEDTRAGCRAGILPRGRH